MKRSISAADVITDQKADVDHVSDAAFAGLMARFRPFEPSPLIAVAVSGGADSMALALLADRWATAQGGRIVAVTVDHRLRAESTDEAARVGSWLAARGIEHHVLPWLGPYPLHGLQAAARLARYDLLGEWCRSRSVLHLLVAHHREDQAETLMLRLGRGSGVTGLAGMAALVECPHYRLIRPLLELPSARLRSTLRVLGQDWVDDPSNRNPAFARVRVRGLDTGLASVGITPARLSTTARHLARARRALERVADTVLAQSVTLDPAGWISADLAPVIAAPEEIRLRCLAAMLATIGGSVYTPRFESLERLDQAIVTQTLSGGRTLGGCRIRMRRDRLLIYREPAAVAPRLALTPGMPALWDGRFRVDWQPNTPSPPNLQLGALGSAAETCARAIVPADKTHHLHRCVWPSLPALWQETRLISVPHLDWRLDSGTMGAVLRFRPSKPLSGSGFWVG
jgi:tRNA(Ile)-lysidine synthase